MSTLKKNKRIKRAKVLALYGDLKPGRGNHKVERGKAKYLGGNGRKTTGITKRLYKKNLQSVRVMEDGRVVRRRISVKLLRSGAVLKAVVRKPFTLPGGVKPAATPKAATKAAKTAAPKASAPKAAPAAKKADAGKGKKDARKS